jgi:hypothetical protein
MALISPEQFWRNYEEKLGEKVLGYCLGRYISGWETFAPDLWGLSIVTASSFRFHHFPHENWFAVLTRSTMGGSPPEEKIIAVPRAHILGAVFMREKNFFKRLFFSPQPRLVLRCKKDDGSETELIIEGDGKAAKLAALLNETP